MKFWLADSIFYACICRMLTSLKSLFGKAKVYVAAFTKKAKATIVDLSRDSIFMKLLNNFTGFLDKQSHSKKSAFYIIMSRFGSLLNKLAASLHGFFGAQLKLSFMWRLLKDIDTGCRKDPYVLSGLICSGFFIAYGAAALTGRVYGIKTSVILGALFIASLILLLAREKAAKTITGSITFKLLRLALKAVLP